MFNDLIQTRESIILEELQEIVNSYRFELCDDITRKSIHAHIRIYFDGQYKTITSSLQGFNITINITFKHNKQFKVKAVLSDKIEVYQF